MSKKAYLEPELSIWASSSGISILERYSASMAIDEWSLFDVEDSEVDNVNDDDSGYVFRD